MPSIRDMFAITEEETPEEGEQDFDLNKFFGHVNDIMASKSEPSLLDSANEALASTAPVVPTEPESPSFEAPAAQTGEGEATAGGTPEPAAPETFHVEPHGETNDPFAEMLRNAVDDPATRARILRAMAGDEPIAPTPIAQAQLPEEIDPQSFEAQLWRDNQDLKQQIHQLSGAVQTTRMSQEENQAARDALAAGQILMNKYPDKLSQEDLNAIASATRESGLLFMVNSPKYQGNRQMAIAEALEATMWTNPTFRSKLVEAPAPTAPGDAIESIERKRKLNALSSAASPVASAAPTAPALETRQDGRLTDRSRQQLVKELATGIARKNFES